jgi:hypothetical protein
LQLLADDAGALLAIRRPGLGEHVGDVVGFDAERLLDYLGGAVTVVGVRNLSIAAMDAATTTRLKIFRGPSYP